MSYDYERYDGKRIVVDGEVIGLLAMEFGHEVEEVWEEYHAELAMTEEQERQSEAYKESLRRTLSAQYEKVATLEAENAKLRELAVLQSVIFKHMSTCPTTDCQVCPVNDECDKSVYIEGVLGIDDKETSWLVQWRSEDAADVRAENAKLRELLSSYWKRTHSPVGPSVERDYLLELRELGVEVD